MSAEPLAPKIGKPMMIIAWIIGMALLTWVLGDWQEARINPNSSPLTETAAGVAQVTLLRNRQGHYLTAGTINHQNVQFLIDTGATRVAIPGGLQQTLGLNRGELHYALTANGRTQAYSTLIKQLSIGDIQLFDVRASILPNMPGQQILLGMSALQHIEFTQKGDRLTLRQLLP